MAAQAEDYSALEASDELVAQICAALRAADCYLTGKADNRAGDRSDVEDLLIGKPWLIHLSDGGHSRMVVQLADSAAPSVWLGGSASASNDIDWS